MSSEKHSFQLGSFQCKVLSDRTYQGPLDFSKFFPTAPPDQLESRISQYQIDPENITLSFNCLFIDTGQSRTLIDTGVGREHGGHFQDHLEAEGISPDSIDHVIFTHGHADHIGGITDVEANLVFPNSKYWMSKPEWDYWQDEANMEHEPPHAIAGAKKNLPLIAEQVNLIEAEGELLAGISVFNIPGHTIGMMGLLIESDDQKLIVAADSFHRPLQIEHTDWNAQSDRVPDKAPGSRQKLLKKAVNEDALLVVYHFPHPGLGRVQVHDSTWKWQPF